MIYPPEEINGKKHGGKIHNGLHPHTAVQSHPPIHQKQERYIQYPFSQNAANERFACPLHGLEIGNSRIANSHKRHRYHLYSQELRDIINRGRLLRKE